MAGGHCLRAVATALLLACAALAGCSSAPTPRGAVQGAEFSSGELLQSEGNRITQNAMTANHRSLMLLADKLYRRNPAEWRKSAATRETALAQLELALLSAQPWAPLAGQRDVAALSLALSPDFAGDRVAAFIVACADTIVTAHGGKREFYYLDGVDPQHLYNAARNMEIALWVLNTRRRRPSDGRGAGHAGTPRPDLRRSPALSPLRGEAAPAAQGGVISPAETPAAAPPPACT